MIMTQTWKNMVTHWVRIISVPKRMISASSAAKTATSCGAMGIFAPQLVAVFAAEDAEIIRLGTLMIRTQCVTMFAHVWVMIINGLFQALGRALPATILGLSRQAICLIPAVIVLSLAFGVNGLAVSQATADVLSMAIAIPMVVRMTRELRRLGETEEAAGTTA